MFIISETELKERINISLNKDAKALRIVCQEVTVLYIEELLGIPLYDLYLNHVTNKTTLTDKQSDLYEIVKMYFAKMVELELAGTLFDYTNQGNKENPNAPTLDVVKFKRGEVYAKAEQIKTYILRYLEANKSDFPQYFSNVPAADAPKLTSGPSPIVFIEEPKIRIGG